MKNRTELNVTLAAVVASLGTALGVASTDLHAATVAAAPGQPAITQHKHRPALNQDKHRPALNQDKHRPALNKDKYRPAINQDKYRP